MLSPLVLRRTDQGVPTARATAHRAADAADGPVVAAIVVTLLAIPHAPPGIPVVVAVLAAVGVGLWPRRHPDAPAPRHAGGSEA